MSRAQFCDIRFTRLSRHLQPFEIDADIDDEPLKLREGGLTPGVRSEVGGCTYPYPYACRAPCSCAHLLDDGAGCTAATAVERWPAVGDGLRFVPAAVFRGVQRRLRSARGGRSRATPASPSP
jgi:hypothetical protein